jgi:hypothetical protein
VQAEQFLRNRNWLVKSFIDVKEALGEIAAQPPHFLMICADIPGEKIRSLPKILSQAFTVPLIVYTEKNGSHAMKSVEDFKIKYKLFPPISGPAIERMFLRMTKEANAANSAETTKATKKNYSFRSNDENQTISISGKKQSDLISISGKKQDEMISVSGSNKNGQFNIVQKGKKSGKIDELLNLSEEIDNEVKELKNKLKLSSDEFDEAETLSSQTFEDDPIQTEDYQENEDTTQSYDSDKNTEPSLQQSMDGNTELSTNQKVDENAELSSLHNIAESTDGLSQQKTEPLSAQSKSEMSELSTAELEENESIHHESEQNFESQSSSDNSDQANLNTPEELSLQKADLESENNNPDSEKTDLLNLASSTDSSSEPTTPEEIESLKRNAFDAEDSNNNLSEFAKKKRRLYKKSKTLGSGQNNSVLDILILAVENTFEKLQGETNSSDNCDLVESINHFFTLTLNTDAYKGYLTIELSKSLNEDFDLIQILKSLLKNQLAELGLNEKFDQVTEVSIQPVPAQNWILKVPTFSRSRLYKTGEIIICYFENQDISPIIESQPGGRMTLNAHENIEEGPIGFNLYLYLPKNKKFIHYKKPHDQIPNQFVSQLASAGVDKVFFLHEELQLVKNSWVNLYFHKIKNQITKELASEDAAA